jgi:hypothetical protein
VTQQKLDLTEVGSGFEEVDGIGVSERLLILLMIRSQSRSAIAFIRSMA